MPATYQGASTAPNYPGGSTATSLTLDRTTGTIGTTTSGDLLIAVVHIEPGDGVAVTLPSGWTQLTSAGTGFTTLTAWKRATGSEPTTYTFSWTGGAYTSGILYRFNGVLGTGTPVVAVAAGSTGPSLGSVSYTAPATGTGVWIYNGVNDSQTITSPAGYTTESTVTLGSTTIATRRDTAGAKTTGTGTTSDSGAQVVVGGVVLDAIDGSTHATTVAVSADGTVLPPVLVVTYRDTTPPVALPGTATTSVTITAPATIATDDILVAVVRLQAGTTQTLTPPTGWTQVGAAAGSTSYLPIDYHFLWKRATASEPGSYTFTYATSANSCGIIHRYSGVIASGDPWAGSTAAYSDGTTIPTLAYTTTTAGTSVWLSGSLNADITVTPPSGYVKRSTLSPSGTSSPTAADRFVLSGSTNTGTGTSSITDARVVFAGTLIPAHTNVAPTANAGPDLYAEPNEEVFLDGTASSDPEGIASIVWTQTGGSPTVQVYGIGSLVSFYAPTVLAGVDLTFTLTVTDTSLVVSTDTVVVHVAPPSMRKLQGGTWQPVPLLLFGVEYLNFVSADVATLTQTFTSNYAGFTQVNGFPSDVAVSGGQLRINAGAGYPTITSDAKYDLTSSAVYAQLVTAPNVGNGSVQTFLTLLDSTGNKLDIGWSGGSLACNQTAGGVVSGFSTTYTAGTDVWLRITHDGTNLVWATSPDKTTWTTKRTAAPAIPLTRLQVILVAGNFNAEPTPGVAVWDNLNS